MGVGHVGMAWISWIRQWWFRWQRVDRGRRLVGTSRTRRLGHSCRSSVVAALINARWARKQRCRVPDWYQEWREKSLPVPSSELGSHMASLADRDAHGTQLSNHKFGQWHFAVLRQRGWRFRSPPSGSPKMALHTLSPSQLPLIVGALGGPSGRVATQGSPSRKQMSSTLTPNPANGWP